MIDFADRNYRRILRDLCKRPDVERGFQAALAKVAGCQASYLSQVLHENAHLTEDQAVNICYHLDFSESETEHFLLLLRFDKAGTPKLKLYLENRIQQSLKEMRNVGQKVPAQKVALKDADMGRYFSSWIHSAVHLLTSHEAYSSVASISRRLNIPSALVADSLSYLESISFVEQIDGKWTYRGGSLHVPKDSHWQSLMQESRRQMASRSIAINPEDAIHFSSVFTINRKDIEEIKKLIKPFLDKSHRIIQQSGTEDLYCLCLDLFSVI